MKYLLEGDFAEVKKILRENRIRVERGLVKFTALPHGGECEDTKEVFVTDTKEPKVLQDEKKTKKTKGK